MITEKPNSTYMYVVSKEEHAILNAVLVRACVALGWVAEEADKSAKIVERGYGYDFDGVKTFQREAERARQDAEILRDLNSRLCSVKDIGVPESTIQPAIAVLNDIQVQLHGLHEIVAKLKESNLVNDTRAHK